MLLPTHRNYCLKILLLIHHTSSPGIIYTLKFIIKKKMHAHGKNQPNKYNSTKPFRKLNLLSSVIPLTGNNHYYQFLVYASKSILWLHEQHVVCTHICIHKVSPFLHKRQQTVLLCTSFVFIFLNISKGILWHQYIHTPTLFWLHNIGFVI